MPRAVCSPRAIWSVCARTGCCNSSRVGIGRSRSMDSVWSQPRSRKRFGRFLALRKPSLLLAETTVQPLSWALSYLPPERIRRVCAIRYARHYGSAFPPSCGHRGSSCSPASRACRAARSTGSPCRSGRHKVGQRCGDSSRGAGSLAEILSAGSNRAKAAGPVHPRLTLGTRMAHPHAIRLSPTVKSPPACPPAGTAAPQAR